MINLSRLVCFAAIVENGSFTGAAESLGLTKAMVSIQLKKLEAELDLSLLTRTTRKLALTEVGETFYRDCVRLVREAEAMVDNAKAGSAALSGVLRVTSTAEFGSLFLIPALAAFAALHPQLKIEFSASPLASDLVAERFDVAIRLGQLSDSTLRATRLGGFRVVAAASRAYMRDRVLPKTPEQLSQFDWVLHAGFLGPLTWSAYRGSRASARRYRVKLTGRYQADTAAGVLAFVQAGAAAGLLPEWLIRKELASGALLDLLPKYALPEQGIYALYPHTHHVAAKVRRLIDFLREHLAQADIY